MRKIGLIQLNLESMESASCKNLSQDYCTQVCRRNGSVISLEGRSCGNGSPRCCTAVAFIDRLVRAFKAWYYSILTVLHTSSLMIRTRCVRPSVSTLTVKERWASAWHGRRKSYAGFGKPTTLLKRCPTRSGRRTWAGRRRSVGLGGVARQPSGKSPGYCCVVRVELRRLPPDRLFLKLYI